MSNIIESWRSLGYVVTCHWTQEFADLIKSEAERLGLSEDAVLALARICADEMLHRLVRVQARRSWPRTTETPF